MTGPRPGADNCILFTAANFVVGMFTGIALAAPMKVLNPMAVGLAGIIATIFGIFLGIMCMVARNAATGRRMPYLYPFGFAGFLVPTLFVLLTLRNEFFPGRTGWW